METESKSFFDLLPQDEKGFFQESILIFDTSALLELYYLNRCTDGTVLEECKSFFKDRIFIPDQIHFEYHKNREKVLKKYSKIYDDLLTAKKNKTPIQSIIEEVKEIEKKATDKIKSVEGKFKTFQEQYSKNDKHPFFDEDAIKEIETIIQKYVKDMKGILNHENSSKQIEIIADQEIQKRKDEIEVDVAEDSIKKIIDEDFKKGRMYSFSEITDIIKEGEFRYRHSIPPGYKDDEKEGFRKYGDLIAWKQIMEICKIQNKGCIFVSNDVKEDWNDKELNAPRQELIREFYETTGKLFSKYPLKDFIYKFTKYFKDALDEGAIESINQYYLKNVLEEDAVDFGKEFLDFIEEKINEYLWRDLDRISFDKHYSVNEIEIISFSSNRCSYTIKVAVILSQTSHIPFYYGRLIYEVQRDINYKDDRIETVNINYKLIDEDIDRSEDIQSMFDELRSLYEDFKCISQ